MTEEELYLTAKELELAEERDWEARCLADTSGRYVSNDLDGRD
jgi:hypothetical protein